MHGVTLSRRQVREVLDEHGLRAQPCPRAELRRRRQHGPAHRPAVGGRARDARWSRSAPVWARSPLALVETGARVTAVEVDRGLVPVAARPGRAARRACRRGRRPDPRLGRAPRDATATGHRPTASWAMVANLPYNVAVPVVRPRPRRGPERAVDARDGPARGGRAAGGRPGRQGLRRGVGEGGVPRHGPRGGTRPGVGVRAPSRGGVGARPHRAPPRRGGGPRRRSPPRGSSSWCGPGFAPPPQDAPAIAGRRGRRPRPSPRPGIDPEARAENLGVEEWGRLAACAPDAPVREHRGDAGGGDVSAPAKLTLSLRVTGVRDDGFHLLDAEMVSIDLADTLTFEPGSGISVRRRGVRRARRRQRARRARQPGGPGARRAWAAAPRSGS